MLNCHSIAVAVYGIEMYRLAKDLKMLIDILSFYKTTDNPHIVCDHLVVLEYIYQLLSFLIISVYFLYSVSKNIKMMTYIYFETYTMERLDFS